MANKHYRNWLYQMPLGFVFATASFFILVYAIKKAPDEQWIILCVAAASALVIGLALFGSAIIHKVKSDLIRKSKKRHTASTVAETELP